MMHTLSRAGVVAVLAVFLASCGQESDGGGQTMSYKEMKSMVIDILGSEEAQKAILKASTTSPAGTEGTTLFAKAMTAQDHEQVKLAVKDVLTSPDYSRVIESIMKDPKFAGEFAKAVSKDNKQIHKDLMKDPDYQKDLVEMLKAPEAQRVLMDAMKTPEFRKQMMAGVTEAMQNPLFKMEVMKMLQTAVKEELTPQTQTQQQQGQSGQQGQKSGGSGDNQGQSGNADSGGGT
jgi:spore germination protein D